MVAVLSDPDLDLRTIRSWARDKLATYKLPSKLIKIDEIPRNAMGKVNKKSLKKELFNSEK